MSFLNQIKKNWSKFQVPIILLIFLFIIITFYQLTQQQQPKPSIQEHFENKEEESGDEDEKVYFMKNYPVQSVKKVWEKEMGDKRYISFWERTGDQSLGYYPIGQIAFTTDESAVKSDISLDEYPGIQYLVKGGQKPIDYTMIWDNQHLKGEAPVSIWRPTPPEGHVAMGDVVVGGHSKPAPDAIHCLPQKVVEKSGKIKGYLWKDPHPKRKTKEGEEVSPQNSFSLWEVGDYGYFFGRDSYQRPDNRKEKIYKVKDEALNQQEVDPNDDGKYIEVTLKI